VASRALSDDALLRFLRRRRRRDKPDGLQNLGSFLAETLDLTSRLVPSEAGSLLLDDPTVRRKGSPLTFVAAFGPAAEDLVGMEIRAGEGVAGQVYRQGRTYATNAPDRDPASFAGVDRQSALPGVRPF